MSLHPIVHIIFKKKKLIEKNQADGILIKASLFDLKYLLYEWMKQEAETHS